MQLILAGNIAENYTNFKKSLDTYKYKDEVILLENLPEDEIIKLTAAAYAFIDVSLNMDTNLMALNALSCEVPVILSKNEAMAETFANTALYVSEENIEDVAAKMMLIFKDEDQRNILIKQGKKHIHAFKPLQITDLLWATIVSATKA